MINTIQIAGEKIEFSFLNIPSRPDSTVFKNALHWEVTINNQKFFYSEGIGNFLGVEINLKHYGDFVACLLGSIRERRFDSNWCAAEYRELIFKKSKTGKPFVVIKKDRCEDANFHSRAGRVSFTITQPNIKDVLYAITADADALSETFSDWCDNLGYNDDSIKAKKTWTDCRKNANKLQKAGCNLKNLQEYFQDY